MDTAFETRGILASRYPKHVAAGSGYSYRVHYAVPFYGEYRALCRVSIHLSDDNGAPEYGAPVTCPRCIARANRTNPNRE